MVSIETTTSRRDGVTCVEAVLANDAAVPLRVTCAVAPDRYWPPRRRGVPEAGWDDGTVTVTVPAGGRTGVGFATPEPPDDGCIAVASTTAVPDAPTDDAPMADAAGVVRTLGDGRPPRDAVPAPAAPAAPADPAATPDATAGGGGEDGAGGGGEDGDGGGGEDGDGGGGGDERGARRAAGDDGTAARESPDESAFEWVEAPVARPVAAWLDDVESRVEHVEALADDPTVARATELLAGAGGVRGVRRTARAGPRLRRLAARADALADRVEAVDAPVDDLEALS